MSAAVALLEAETRKLNLLSAAIRFCDRHEEIARLTRQAQAIPGCAAPGDPTDYCTDRMRRPAGFDYEAEPIRWWEMKTAELATLCEPCRARVDIWRERSRLKAGRGGAMRALLVAFRAYVAVSGGAQ